MKLMLTQYDCNMYPILALISLNEEGDLQQRFDTNSVKFITPFDLHKHILDTKFNVKV